MEYRYVIFYSEVSTQTNIQILIAAARPKKLNVLNIFSLLITLSYVKSR